MYTLLGLALVVCAQFQLERKHQFYFRVTSVGSLMTSPDPTSKTISVVAGSFI